MKLIQLHTSNTSCTEPIETPTESNCYCYSQPKIDFEHSICAPKKCPLDDACCIGEYNTTDANYQSVYGRCFCIEREAKTFVNSKENCKAKGGKIYEPKNVVELNEIANLSARLGIWGFVWIGVRIIYNNPHNLNMPTMSMIVIIKSSISILLGLVKELGYLTMESGEHITVNVLARVQWVHAPADHWDITFCTR